MSGCSDVGLTFEQRRELLPLQTEMEKLAVEKPGRAAEIQRWEMEEWRLSLPAIGASQASDFSSRLTSFEVASNLRLVPQFIERDPDTFSHCLSE